MHLEVNGAPHEVEATDLTGLLVELGYDAATVATALNGAFVPRSLRHTATLAPGARVDVVMPMQGG